MKEKLILDYMKANDIKLYKDSNKLRYISHAGEYILVTEESDCLNYTEQHMIPLIDILAWVYSFHTGVNESTLSVPTCGRL